MTAYLLLLPLLIACGVFTAMFLQEEDNHAS